MTGNANRKLRNEINGFVFAMPVILGVLIFTFYPAVQSLFYAFTNFDGAYKMDWVGFNNFLLMFRDTETALVFKNTFLYALISVPVNLLLGYFLALIANFKVKGISLFRTLFYLPVIIPSVASALVFKDLFATSSVGVLNRILTGMGLQAYPFFDRSESAMFSLIYMNSWTIGGGMIIWLAAFKNIPVTLYESARLDGASPFRQLISITIPMSTPMIFYNLVTGIIGALQANQTMILFGGNGAVGFGPDKSLYFVCVKIYNTAFRDFHQGYASAYAWFLFMIIAVLTAVIFKTNKWVYYGDD